MKVAELKAELQKMEKEKLQQVNVEGAGADANNNEATDMHNIDDSMFREEMRALKNRRVMLTAQQFLDQVKVRSETT